MADIPLLHIFPCCSGLPTVASLDEVLVKSVCISRANASMKATVWFPRQPSGAELTSMSQRIMQEYGLSAVNIFPEYPAPIAEKEIKKIKNAEKKESNDAILLGKTIKGEKTDMELLTQESGNVVVEGKVFAVDNRDLKNDAWLLSFSITDYTGSVKVSYYSKKGEDRTQLKTIQEGMHLLVEGYVAYNRYDDDIRLQANSIALGKETKRVDNSEEKRVELHLHTRFSALDAFTDPAEAVKTAARWGHKAIAVTDHGVAHAFPDMWHAADKAGIKMIYGVEGYYVNDVDELLTVSRKSDLPLHCEFAAFDLETTGLDATKDHITEIGAVIFSGEGRILKSFQTFVNPGVPIPPQIVNLTGISDRDVAGAPSESTAVKDFLAFVGDRPLVAHNAQFDVGFVARLARENNLSFDPLYIDTLPMSQSLLPELKRHKLDSVSHALGLPDFSHHRASDDAGVCGRIFLTLLEQVESAGGNCLNDVERICEESSRKGGNHKVRHIIILTKTKAGLKNLYELISKSHLEHFKRKPIIPKSLLVKYREGLIIGSACEAGEVFAAVLDKRADSELERLGAFYDFLEIQPLCNNRFLLEEGKVESEEDLRNLNRKVVALAKKLGKPFCATGDVHFLEPRDEIYRHILLAGQKFSDADKPLPLYLKTTDEMLEEFSYLGQEDCYKAVIGYPNAIADMVESFALLPSNLFPPTIPNAAEDLERLCWDKTHALYGENPPAIVQERVQEELDAILGRHYEVIYMSAQKLVQNSLENGYLVGSRGSVGSSMVAYMAGITEVNSLPPHYRCPQCQYSDFDPVYDSETGKKFDCGVDMPDKLCPHCGTLMAKEGFDIPFETFLGFGGDKVPDIDLNFSGEYQAKAHKYTEELFGSDHVFRAGTISTLAEKTAFGYVKKYLAEREIIVTKAEENRLAAGCVGVKRTTGQHPGGLVIIPQDMDVTDFCPVQHPADDSDGGIITTHFEYHSMEANLLKLDELGHDDPTMIRMMEDLTGVDARLIPLDDKETMGIFTSAEPLGIMVDDEIIGETGTLGVPEFGTNFTRNMLVDTKPTQFNTLVRLSGFSHGTGVWAGNIRDLVLDRIAEVDQCVGCRDDIMTYLISMGMAPRRAFKFMEDVRKGIIHKGKQWQEGIVEEMQELGVPEWWIQSCRKIEYLFPKAHAVAYVTMAFRIAWFKVHKPLAYYSAYFYRRSEKNSFDAELMTMGIEKVRQSLKKLRATTDDNGKEKEATAKEGELITTLEVVYEFYLRGFTFLPLDIYKSDARKFEVEGNALRPPFVSVSGLGETAAEDLLNCRDKDLVSIEDISRICTKVSQSHLASLKQLGAFGGLPDSAQTNLFDSLL